MTEKTTKVSPMQALLDDDTTLPPPPVPGQLVTGIVVNLQNNRILVEIAGVYTAIIGGREAIDGLGTAKNLSVGDEVSAYVVEDENTEGLYILSLRKAGTEKAWQKIVEMQKNGEAVTVRVKEANKGGLMSELSGIRAFIPVSQLAPEHYPRVSGANASEILRRLNQYIGEEFTVKIITADQSEDKLILSEREAIGIKRATALKKIKVGQTIKGKVSGVVNFGIFILFESCLEGLVHVSEIAWGRVSDPASYARLGEEKEAAVIGIENDKISLSIKRLTPDPWIKLVEDYTVGDVVDGEVNKITPFGAFITIKKDLNGLIHISEISQDEDSEKAEVNLKAGDKVKAKIINIDVAEHRLGLSLKDMEEKKTTKKKATKAKETKPKTEKVEKKPTKKKAEKEEKSEK